MHRYPWSAVARSSWLALAAVPLLALVAASLAWSASAGGRPSRAITISIVGTTDLHGRLYPEWGRGGLAQFGGYLAALRAVRAAESGAVILLDSGDTYQGGIESNLSEGSVVVDAYNALGYTAGTFGNHDFEYGAEDVHEAWDAPPADPRGALKARAAQARYPLLAANVFDAHTGRRIDWPNVQPSVLVQAAGVSVGIVGVITEDAIRLSLPATVEGLRVGSVEEAIREEATRLKAAGAVIVVVAGHVGGRCEAFDDPSNLASCDPDAEIFRAAQQLPPGLVDVIMAGHTHGSVAHRVGGIAVAQAGSWGQAFSRVDVTLAADRRQVADVRILPPRVICAHENLDPTRCDAPAPAGAGPPRYEGRAVMPDAAVAAAMEPALGRVRERRTQSVGVSLDTPLVRSVRHDSPVGNLFADALRNTTPGADVGVAHASGPGGLRADLPVGPLAFGALYDVFPFDNRVVRLTLTAAHLEQLLVESVRRPRWRGRVLGVSGIHVVMTCRGDEIDASLTRPSGAAIRPDDALVVAVVDTIASRARAVLPRDALQDAGPQRLVRVAVAEWLRRQGGRFQEASVRDPQRPRWVYDDQDGGCTPAP